MKFTITSHAALTNSRRPADALELLWQQLGSTREEVSFTKAGSEIVATWGEDAPASMEADERAELGRRAVLRIVSDVCESSPDLDLEWFAVGAFR